MAEERRTGRAGSFISFAVSQAVIEMEQPLCAARREEAGLLHQGTAARGAAAVKVKISGSST